MYQLVFRLGNGHRISLNNIKPNLTILDIAFDNKIDIQSLCGGVGVCKECHIQIEEGANFLDGENINTESENEVYACQARLIDGMTGRLVIKLE